MKLNRFNQFIKLAAITALVVIAAATSANAQTVWNNNGTSWDTAANWSDGVPTISTLASFSPQGGGLDLLSANPIITGSQSALGVLLSNSYFNAGYLPTATLFPAEERSRLEHPTSSSAASALATPSTTSPSQAMPQTTSPSTSAPTQDSVSAAQPRRRPTRETTASRVVS